MTYKRAWALGASAMAMLVSHGIIAAGCAGGNATETGGITCVAETEVCDNFDNDCDGLVDEDCDCKPGVTQACYAGPEDSKGKGICAEGKQTCNDKGKWSACDGQVLPVDSDACDGVDNNCDGIIDENCACSPPSKGTTQPCYTGPENTEGVGACLAGYNFCKADGTWDDKCKDEVKPKAEKCDGFDNDCDGEIDNLPDKKCGVGECQVTVVACTNGEPTPCVVLPPKIEVCDGLDNDCDQLTDESDPASGTPCDSGLTGVCAAGELTCKDSKMVCVAAKVATPEKCDGIDNDCDGTIDEEVEGTGSSCSTGIPGICAMGMIQCQGSTIDCFPITPPSSEICDNLDNNCDGSTDEGNPGGGEACDTGKLGVCQPGTLNCVNGVVECTQHVASSPETCDTLDNDCNGAADDGDPGGGSTCTTGQLGPCAQGVKHCTDGAVTCVPNVTPEQESCDGIDNDCNGLPDDNNPGGGLACTTGLQGVCSNGMMTCTGGSLVCKQNVQPGPELCSNGLDDNCDGVTDPVVTVYFSEDFANNMKGWTLGTSWAIGPTLASIGHGYGNADPASDHSPTADNGVAGVVLGGNAVKAIHSAYYLTSPVIDTSAATSLYLEYWRWLNSDWAPYMVNTVEVFNGTSWIVLWQSGGLPGVQDIEWKKQTHDVAAHKNALFQFRFGFSQTSGAYVVSQWNIDDVKLVNAICQ